MEESNWQQIPPALPRRLLARKEFPDEQIGPETVFWRSLAILCVLLLGLGFFLGIDFIDEKLMHALLVMVGAFIMISNPSLAVLFMIATDLASRLSLAQ